MGRSNQDINEEVNEVFAEFTGIIIGDGHIYKNRVGGSFLFKIVGNPIDEIEYYSFVSLLLSKIIHKNINPRLQDQGRSYGISFGSNLLGKKLYELGIPFGKKSHIVTIPDRIYSDSKLNIACLRGIFDTDGCLTLKKRYRNIPYYPTITIKSASRNLILQISNILSQLKIQHSIVLNQMSYDSRTNKTYVGHYVHVNGFVNVSRWFKLIGTSHPKVKKKFNSIKGVIKLTTPRIQKHAKPILDMIN